MSGTIGTGNIAGVATAIVSGGPGALFWIWAYGFVATTIKFTEAVLGVTTVEVDPVVDPARIGAAIVDRIDVLRLRKPCPRGSLSIWFRIRPGLIR